MITTPGPRCAVATALLVGLTLGPWTAVAQTAPPSSADEKGESSAAPVSPEGESSAADGAAPAPEAAPAAPAATPAAAAPTTAPVPAAAPAAGSLPPGGWMPSLTEAQLEMFAQLTGDDRTDVLQRLALDPELSAMAGPAADRRRSRRRAGMALTITGFGILIAGDLAGAAIIVATPGYPVIEPGEEDQVLLGLGVAAASAVVGLSIGIPGVVKLARTTDIEAEAYDRYWNGPGSMATAPAATPVPAAAVPPTSRALDLPFSRGVAFGVPLVNLAF